MSAVLGTESRRSLRIGELAEVTGTTPRTIRYYEELGLLPKRAGREHGRHRIYTETDVERVRQVVALKDLLGLSLERLSKLVEAETARAELRREYRQTDDAVARRRILEEALGHLANQIELVKARRRELDQLERDLIARQRLVRGSLRELTS